MSSHSHDGKTSTCKNCIDAKSSERKMRQQRLGDLAWAVYFIQDSRNNRVKIGSCDDPYVALETLQKGSSETLHLLASHEAGQKESAENIESTLHSLFQTHYTGHGWFEMVPSLEQYISLRKILKVRCTFCFKLTTQDTDGLKWCLHWNSTFPLFSRKITTRRKFYSIQWKTLKMKLLKRQSQKTSQKELCLLRDRNSPVLQQHPTQPDILLNS